MGFFYSHATGLIQSHNSTTHPTKDDAMKAFYLEQMNNLLRERKTKEDSLRTTNNDITKLKNEFSWLIEKYPEEFI